MTLGDFLCHLREQAGLTRAQAAEAVGCSRQWVYDVEGGANPDRHLNDFLRAYGATQDEAMKAALLRSGVSPDFAA